MSWKTVSLATVCGKYLLFILSVWENTEIGSDVMICLKINLDNFCLPWKKVKIGSLEFLV